MAENIDGPSRLLPRMKLPLVAIVGRPNVGKSSLLNCLAGRRVSIVDPTPGVTRDRVSATIEYDGLAFEIVDTGGIGIVDRDDLGVHVESQIARAMADASLILFVVDVREGVKQLDREVAQRLRERATSIPVLLVVNKVDSARQEPDVADFFSLGMGEPIAVSAEQILGTRDLLARVIEKLAGPGRPARATEPVLKLAVVGRQNVGKSTFVNAIAREERVIVSEVPGTTRDAVDVQFEKDGRKFVIIDTAGIQQKSKVKSSIEFFSQVRMEDAVRRCDVALLLLDATQEVTRSEKRLGEFIANEGKVCIVVANKWDLAAGNMTTGEYAEYLGARMPGLRYAPISCVTAKESRNIQATIDLAQALFKTSLRRVGTGELNRVLKVVREQNRPRSRGTKAPRIYYGTQVTTAPPTFVIFVNDPSIFPPDYRRYVEGAFRESLGFAEIPLRIHYRARQREDDGQGS